MRKKSQTISREVASRILAFAKHSGRGYNAVEESNDTLSAIPVYTPRDSSLRDMPGGLQ